MAEKRPNILLMFADDQRHTALGCCDDPCADPVRTPYQDKLAAEGTRFSHAFHAGSQIPAVCAPSRGMLHTGRSPETLPGRFIDDPNNPLFAKGDAPLLGELLQAQGYHTHHVGKWHNGQDAFERSFMTGESVFLSGMDNHFNLPIRNYDREKGGWKRSMHHGAHATDVFQCNAENFLEQVEQGKINQPFFLQVAFTAPHDPRRTHQYWHDRYPREDMPLPPNYRERYDYYGPECRVRDEMQVALPRLEEQIQQEMSDYFAMVEHMDYAIGQILVALEASGQAENTIVIHSADHGLAVGQHGLMGKQNMHDHSVRVPLLMRGPGIPAGEVNQGLCYQHDLFPTLLEAADSAIPEECAYQSLWPLLRGEKANNYEKVTSFYASYSRMERTHDKKTMTFERESGPLVVEYDVASDPWEQNGKVVRGAVE